MRYKEEDRISWQELFDDPIFNVGALNLENFNIIQMEKDDEIWGSRKFDNIEDEFEVADMSENQIQ